MREMENWMIVSIGKTAVGQAHLVLLDKLI